MFAALTSAFSMIEIIVAAITKGDDTGRRKWTWAIGLLIFIVGIPACLSYGVLDKPAIFGKTFFDAADYVVSNILLPLGALLMSLFIPLKLSKKIYTMK